MKINMKTLKGRNRLNIGSGKDYRDNYFNLEKHEQFKSDLQADMREIEFPDNTFREILAQDVLDHIVYFEALSYIKKLYGWLMNDGILNIHLPHFEHCAKMALAGDHEAMVWIYGSDGRRAHYSTNVIRWGYTPKSMRHILEDIGFIIIHEEVDCLGYGFRMIGVKRL